MKSVIASLVALAGIASAASADTLFSFDIVNVTHDRGTTAGAINAQPGDIIEITAQVSYTGGPAVVGFGSAVFQPTVQGFLGGVSPDTMLPLITNATGGSSNQQGGMATDFAGSYGRIVPWGRTFLSSSNAITGFNNNSVGQPAGSWLRIAQRQVTAWIGGAGNTTGGSGVNCAQLANVGRTTLDPAFNPGLNNVHLFRFAIQIGADAGPRDLLVDAPLSGFSRNTTTGLRDVGWYSDLNVNQPDVRDVPTIVGGAIHVPTPASLALLGLGGVVVGRRRR